MLPGHLAAQERTTISTFPATSYYLGYAEFAAKTDGEIRIAAGGKYALYLNGDLVGTDDGPTTVETWEASLSGGPISLRWRWSTAAHGPNTVFF